MGILKYLVIISIFFTLSSTKSPKDEILESLSQFNTYDILMEMKAAVHDSKCKTECCRQLFYYLEKIFYQNWATTMFDATSKIQAGILNGNLYELGSYDECLEVNLENATEKFQTKYCMGSIKLPESIFNGVKLIDSFETREMMLPSEDLSPKLKYAFCIPDSCFAEEFSNLVNNMTRFFARSFLPIEFVDQKCFVNKSYPLEGEDITAIVILSITAFFIILSTCYDLYLNKYELKPAHPLLTCFSFYTNGYHLFKVAPMQKYSGTLNSMIGIRFLSMAWIVYAHCYYVSAAFPIFNYMETDGFVRSVSGQLIVGSSITVDTFLLMSGLLVSYTLLRQFKDGISFKAIPFIYIHRYIRLTPAYAMMILLQVSLVKYMGSGPLWDATFNGMASGCRQYWWSSLLYIQNYVNPKEVCLGQSWYLSVDMQLFWIAPFLMMFIRKFNRFTYIIIGLLTAIFIAITFGIAYDNNLLAGLIAGTNKQRGDRGSMYYVPTHTRAAPWLIGLALGYLMHEYRGKRMRMKPILVIVGWLICIATMLAIIFGMYPLMEKKHQMDLGDPFYLALSRPAWGLAVGWMILACENGYGGPINWLLTLPLFQPLARLSYSEYLIHFVFQASVGGVARAPMYYTNFQMFYKFLSDCSASLMFAVLLSLTYESPMVIIEKTIFGKAKKPAVKQTESTANIINNDKDEEKFTKVDLH